MKFNADYVHKLFDNDKRIEKLLQKHKIPSIRVGVIKNGKVQQIRTFGYKKSNQPISNNSIYSCFFNKVCYSICCIKTRYPRWVTVCLSVARILSSGVSE